MPWVLLPFLLPLVLFAFFLRRVLRISRLVRDPEQLRSLFSSDLRAALREAGLDPDTVSLEEIQESEELAPLFVADLRRALRSVALGRSLPGGGARPVGPSPHPDHGAISAASAWPTGEPGGAAEPLIPPPIDRPSGAGARLVMMLVLAGLIALGVFALGLQR